MVKRNLIFQSNIATASACPHYFSLRSTLLWAALLGINAAVSAQDPFITTWKTDNPGTSSGSSITIPTNGGAGDYNYEVDWDNDGTYDETGITGDVTHDFGVAGTYTIRLRGDFPAIYFLGGGDCQKLLDVTQWGDIAWTSMEFAFAGCSNLNISATDLPDLSGVMSMAYMFHACAILNSPANIGNWDTENVIDMNSLFLTAEVFNQPIGSWNTDNVTNMSYMFSTTAFNQPIGAWNTANVTDMSYMFSATTAFNQPIGSWNTANVINMSSMFNAATAFNQPIGTWDTGRVSDMNEMFSLTGAFNQPIGNWNTANVGYMNYMFLFADAFNQPIGNWNTANVLEMLGMFNAATAFNQPIGNWNTAKVTTMLVMFANNNVFNQPIGNWNTVSVTSMGSMFGNNNVFNQPIGNWNTANVTDMFGMFNGATAFNRSLSNWTINASADLGFMFNNSGMDCDNYSATLIGWNNNPLTPGGRTLGATGLLYGNNAAAARTNLMTNKGWSINGDNPSGQNCPLVVPVNLVDFTARQRGSGVRLEWTSANEYNNAGFHVERSHDSRLWADIGFKPGQGTTSNKHYYTFPDDKPLPGINYYRLRQTDFDGRAILSNVVSVACPVELAQVFPNPVSEGVLNVHLHENMEDEVLLQLFCPAGQLLRSMPLTKGNNGLDVSELATGIYTLQLRGGLEMVVEKIVVQN